MADLPPFLQDLVYFLVKMLKGHSSLDECLLDALEKDPLCQAETVIMSGPFKKLALLDIATLLQDHKAFTAPPVQETPAPEPTPAPAAEKADDAADAEDQDEEMPRPENVEPADAAPAPLDRASFFPDMVINSVCADVLNRVGETQFTELYDWASLRILAWMQNFLVC